MLLKELFFLLLFHFTSIINLPKLEKLFKIKNICIIKTCKYYYSFIFLNQLLIGILFYQKLKNMIKKTIYCILVSYLLFSFLRNELIQFNVKVFIVLLVLL